MGGALSSGTASQHDHTRTASRFHPCYNRNLATSVGVAPRKIIGFSEGRQLKEKFSPFGVGG